MAGVKQVVGGPDGARNLSDVADRTRFEDIDLRSERFVLESIILII